MSVGAPSDTNVVLRTLLDLYIGVRMRRWMLALTSTGVTSGGGG